MDDIKDLIERLRHVRVGDDLWRAVNDAKVAIEQQDAEIERQKQTITALAGLLKRAMSHIDATQSLWKEIDAAITELGSGR
jgi:hypothetical protein